MPDYSEFRSRTGTQIILRVLTVALILTAFAAAQTRIGQISGTLSDPAGQPLPGASLLLVEPLTGFRAKTQSGADGRWTFQALGPGTYTLSIQREGFQTLMHEGLRIGPAERVELSLTLGIGAFSQELRVGAEAPVLQTGSGSLSFALRQRPVAELPLDGRNFIPLIATMPGVALPPGQVLPRIAGSRPRTSEYLYDGISVLQPEPGQVAYFPIPDAIEELRVQTNSYPAEYGRSTGGVVQVATRSGGNEYHGTAFGFVRHEALNARNVFATASPKPLFRRGQYGGVLGGPVRRDRPFFFGAWQHTGLRNGVVRVSTVPAAAEREGRFSTPVFDPRSTAATPDGWTRTPFPNNTIPAGRFDTAASRLLSRFPLPNVYSASGTEAAANNFRRTAGERVSADQFDTRADALANSAHRLFARYSYLRDRSLPASPLPDGSGRIASGITGDTLTRGDSVAAEHVWMHTSRSVSQTRFGYTRRALRRESGSAGADITIPNMPASPFPNLLPVIDLAGYQQLGSPAGANARLTTRVMQLAPGWSVHSGHHGVKAGADLRWFALDVLQPVFPAGAFTFDSTLTAALTPAGSPSANTGSPVASFLLGEVQSFTADHQAEKLQPRASVYEFFLQDDWNAGRRLTLNAGVRYTLNRPSVEARDRAAALDLHARQLRFAGRDGAPRSFRDAGYLNFAPRLGMALRLSGRSVARAGYGLTWIDQSGISTPFTSPLFPFVQTWGERSLDNRTAAFRLSDGPSSRPVENGPDAGLGQGVFAVQRDNGSGYAQQWNLTLQFTPAENWSLEGGYAGSKLTRLGVPDVNLNQLRVEQLEQGSALTRPVSNPMFGSLPVSSPLGQPLIAHHQLLRTYPAFTSVALYRNNTGHSTYHSFQTRLERRFAAAFTATAAYTFSKLIDDAGAVFDSAVLAGPAAVYQTADSFNRRLEKDESTGSLPHVFSSAWVWEFWRGWKVSGLVRLQSGLLLPVTQAVNLNGAFGFGIQRPNRLHDPNNFDRRSTSRWFDTKAFEAAPQFTLGNSSRNPVRGPAYQAADLMIGKVFSLGERWRAELRAEAFNVTNTPPLGQPNGSFGSPAFGSITTALDPRVFELVLKLHF